MDHERTRDPILYEFRQKLMAAEKKSKMTASEENHCYTKSIARLSAAVRDECQVLWNEMSAAKGKP